MHRNPEKASALHDKCRTAHFFGEKILLHLICVDHLLDHLTADRTGLTGSEITVITLVESYTNITGSFHFELFKSSLCFGNKILIVSHLNFSLCEQPHTRTLAIYIN